MFKVMKSEFTVIVAITNYLAEVATNDTMTQKQSDPVDKTYFILVPSPNLMKSFFQLQSDAGYYDCLLKHLYFSYLGEI